MIVSKVLHNPPLILSLLNGALTLIDECPKITKGDDYMLRSCQYCGRIHESKEMCPPKREAQARRWNRKNDKQVLEFRRTHLWTRKSKRIRERDNYMCVCCLNNLEGTTKEINTENLSVHHIIPIAEDYNKRLDDDNLITVCDIHHEMCEAGKIDRKTQRKLINDNNI